MNVSANTGGIVMRLQSTHKLGQIVVHQTGARASEDLGQSLASGRVEKVLNLRNGLAISNVLLSGVNNQL
jgi:hypothetical protein